MQELLKTYTPEAVAVEELFFNTNITTGIRVAEARGIILLCAVGLAFVPSWILAFVGVVFGFLGVFLIFKQMGNEQKNNVRYQEIVQKKKVELLYGGSQVKSFLLIQKWN